VLGRSSDGKASIICGAGVATQFRVGQAGGHDLIVLPR
jgi:hypothetical protein